MAATVEELYRNYGILADAKEDLSKVILDGVKGGPKEKRLAAQFIPKFFSSFPELADAAINAQLDLCEDEDVSIRRQAIKELPRFASGENLPRVADILTQLLQTDDSAEFNQVNTALISIFKIDAKGTLGGLFSQILQGEDIVRERAIKFLSTKLKTMPDDAMTKEVEDYIFIETKKVLEDVTGEEFVLLMRILSGLKTMQTVSGRQQLVELVVEQAFLEQALNPADADSVDRLLQCTRQALPLFSKNVHSTRFVTYFCEFVLPNLSLLTSPVAELDIQLEVLKLLAEMSPYCGDMDKLEVNLNMLFEKLLEFMPLPPEEENGENAANEEPKLQFSYVECLLFSFHQLGKKLPDFLIDKISAEKLKDFKIRLQYFARGLQVYIRQLRVALQGKTGDALKTEENKIKVVALKITNNINVLIKDLFHNPPSYKSTVTLSWKPVQKTEAAAAAAAIGQKRQSGEDIGATVTTKKLPTNLPRRDARQIYNPPSGKYSASIGNFSYGFPLYTCNFWSHRLETAVPVKIEPGLPALGRTELEASIVSRTEGEMNDSNHRTFPNGAARDVTGFVIHHAQPAVDMESFNVVGTLQPAERALFWVGALTTASLALWLLYKIITGFRIWVLGNGDLLSPKLGKWAVVTGATDGIGKSYAEELARRGFSMMLISRSQEKLDDVAKSLESTYNVETKTIAVDYGQNDIYPKIEKGLAGLEIGVLVNNVGISYPYPEFFLHIPDLENFITNMINVNITSVCQAFVDFFSRGLQAEYKCKGIIIQSVLPFFVATKMTKIRKPTLDKPTPERYVAAELTTVGLQDQTNGYFPHAVMGWVTTVLAPIKLVLYLGLRMNKAQRGGYLRRRKLR
ncbi:apoptosis inhibitor 5 [Labeo rohita]|uniref:Apoptosis inhibitor 5 n=3 Tax=Labeonini TaxID=2743697 RepID=A0A498MBP6_LABRO|nr:apoptosis inhibitor 5 [Labeo rohita]RXN23364.1 apoptosis inhibitor 5 [Labeo rohita]